MANIRKSFSFRNGVQVDENNFVVNANGLVGIGTSVPSEILDVRGTTKVVGLVTSSDRNLKENITIIPNALDKVKALTGNTFNWKSNLEPVIHDYVGTDDTGVIAQEVEALGLPGITTTREDGVKAVRYEKLIPVLIQAIKELSAKVDELS